MPPCAPPSSRPPPPVVWLPCRPRRAQRWSATASAPAGRAASTAPLMCTCRCGGGAGCCTRPASQPATQPASQPASPAGHQPQQAPGARRSASARGSRGPGPRSPPLPLTAPHPPYLPPARVRPRRVHGRGGGHHLFIRHRHHRLGYPSFCLPCRHPGAGALGGCRRGRRVQTGPPQTPTVWPVGAPASGAARRSSGCPAGELTSAAHPPLRLPPPLPPLTRQVMDEGCSYPIQQGAKLSRARVFTFKHNDADDLAALLDRIEAAEKRERWVWGGWCLLADGGRRFGACRERARRGRAASAAPTPPALRRPRLPPQQAAVPEDDRGGGRVQQHGRGRAAQVGPGAEGPARRGGEPQAACRAGPPAPVEALDPRSGGVSAAAGRANPRLAAAAAHPTPGASMSSRSATSTGCASRRRCRSACSARPAAARARRRGSSPARCAAGWGRRCKGRRAAAWSEALPPAAGRSRRPAFPWLLTPPPPCPPP
jgi:hypothetical protein